MARVWPHRKCSQLSGGHGVKSTKIHQKNNTDTTLSQNDNGIAGHDLPISIKTIIEKPTFGDGLTPLLTNSSSWSFSRDVHSSVSVSCCSSALPVSSSSFACPAGGGGSSDLALFAAEPLAAPSTAESAESLPGPAARFCARPARPPAGAATAADASGGAEELGAGENRTVKRCWPLSSSSESP